MNEKAYRTLEFAKILKLLEGFAISPMGKKLTSELIPTADIIKIRQGQKETSESASMILKKGSLPLGGIKDVTQPLMRAEMGGTLSIGELMQVGEFLYVVRKVKNYSKNDGRIMPSELLDPMFELVTPVSGLEDEISRCILNEHDIADDASAALKAVRRSMKISNERIKEHLNSIIHSQTYKNMLQDTVITVRGNRYCVPIKQEYRNSFAGMVHDQSSTGATLFIEPMSVVTLNNKIKELVAEEAEEIEKILRMLSGMIASNIETLTANLTLITRLDFLFAKGELSLSMRASEPVFNTRGYINIKKGRHPLLPQDKVVPIDIYLGDKFHILLITGPNTGGKTVTLKTVGLFTMMGQAGLHIPAFDNSELAVFDGVFADIGDEQSIEQSLSTFSSHMTNIVAVLGSVTRQSLVLLDELGAGTDPTEGAALAIAIIRYFHERNIRCVITTHHSELKMFALSTDGVENAACEFNVETLRPTYRLLIGTPGKSNAFAISQKLGLPEEIVSAARDVLSHEDERFEDIITDLEMSKKAVILEQERAEQFRRDAEKLKTDYETQKTRLTEQREKLLAAAREEARRLVSDSAEEINALMKEFRRMVKENASQKELDEKRLEVREKISKLEEAAAPSLVPQKQKKPIDRKLAIGDRVYIHSLNQTGTVVFLPDSSGKLTVGMGIMQIKTHLDDLSLDDTVEQRQKEKYKQQAYVSKSQNISLELDLRGMNAEEAIEKADKYLDDAYLSSLSSVSIIHGKGTGVLREAIQKHLRNHPYVKSYRLGQVGEGESGVTVVEIKK